MSQNQKPISNITQRPRHESLFTVWLNIINTLKSQYIQFECLLQDTSFNIGPDDVSRNIKVDSDKLPLQDKKRVFVNKEKQLIIYTLCAQPSRLTKRDELSFLTVLALPKDSRMGLACRSCRSNSPCGGGGRRTGKNHVSRSSAVNRLAPVFHGSAAGQNLQRSLQRSLQLCIGSPGSSPHPHHHADRTRCVSQGEFKAMMEPKHIVSCNAWERSSM